MFKALREIPPYEAMKVREWRMRRLGLKCLYALTINYQKQAIKRNTQVMATQKYLKRLTRMAFLRLKEVTRTRIR